MTSPPSPTTDRQQRRRHPQQPARVACARLNPHPDPRTPLEARSHAPQHANLAVTAWKLAGSSNMAGAAQAYPVVCSTGEGSKRPCRPNWAALPTCPAPQCEKSLPKGRRTSQGSPGRGPRPHIVMLDHEPLQLRPISSSALTSHPTSPRPFRCASRRPHPRVASSPSSPTPLAIALRVDLHPYPTPNPVTKRPSQATIASAPQPSSQWQTSRRGLFMSKPLSPLRPLRTPTNRLSAQAPHSRHGRHLRRLGEDTLDPA